jgi:hypothetical protein
MKRTYLLLIVLVASGCMSESDKLKRARAHIDIMKPTYDRGVATYPHPNDRRVREAHWESLERLLDEGAATP